MSGSPVRRADVEELVAAYRADLAAAGMFAAHPVTSVARTFFTRIGVDGWARLPLSEQCALPHEFLAESIESADMDRSGA